MIIDNNGRPALSAKHELELNRLETATVRWLGESVTEAMRTSKNGTLALNVAELKSRLDQLYMLGRHHEAGK